MLTPQQIADKWKQAMGGAAKAYTDGIDAMTVNPMQLAAAQADRAGQAYVAAIPRMVQRLQNSDLAAYKQKCKTKGAARLVDGAAGAAAKVAKYHSIASPIYSAAKQQIAAMPKGGRANALARVGAALDAMDQIKTAYAASA